MPDPAQYTGREISSANGWTVVAVDQPMGLVRVYGPYPTAEMASGAAVAWQNELLGEGLHTVMVTVHPILVLR